ncbi:ribosome small subunit-dependent GTPase A [Lysinibacillus mangiferihumi]|uniref:ribosome small subunit-dependent GTPase A n=1 Tax=Lysinibacillus mangiferihumi TaxID=1130819 RepID=UPI001F17FFCF|nr:ribosome small subunit-dependent GTPase A [Lysinibacillus mangiferihumi]
MINLKTFGLLDSIYDQFLHFESQGYSLGRVVSEHKGLYKVITEFGEVIGNLPGSFLNGISESSDYPTVGDWVLCTIREYEMRATIHKVFERFSKISRNAVGKANQEQVIATNINTVFITVSLNSDFNLRRIERYLTATYDSGCNPVIVLTKCDLVSEEELLKRFGEVRDIAFGTSIYSVSVVTGKGIGEIEKYCGEGQTVALLGSSGAGKSTLCNYLTGIELQKTQDIRNDDKGRHTTTHRQLINLPSGGNLIDTPGMRELQVWDTNNSVTNSFTDIKELASTCYFNNCTHINEPGCSVLSAIEQNILNKDRLDNYFKVENEIKHLERKNDKIKQSQFKKCQKKEARYRKKVNLFK